MRSSHFMYGLAVASLLVAACSDAPSDQPDGGDGGAPDASAGPVTSHDASVPPAHDAAPAVDSAVSDASSSAVDAAESDADAGPVIVLADAAIEAGDAGGASDAGDAASPDAGNDDAGACTSGPCTCHPPAATWCGAACTDLTSDPANCGTCGNACPAYATCQAGGSSGGSVCACTDPAHPFPCGVACTDIKTDLHNCGGCGIVCGAGNICQNAVCTPVAGAYPGNSNGGFTAARGFMLTLQTLAPSVIHYTTDGSTPNAGSPSGASPVNISIGGSTVVRWFSSLDPNIRTHNVTVNTGLQSQIGDLMDQVRFDKSGGPVVQASPGEALSGYANQQVWGGQGYCPSCVRVYGIGVRAVEQCFGAEVPPNWPGTTWNNYRFTVTAPTQPGIYHLARGVNLDYRCYPGTGVGGDDGTIVVQ